MVFSCTICGDPADYICDACSGVRYCGEECQKLDWLAHRSVCVAALHDDGDEQGSDEELIGGEYYKGPRVAWQGISFAQPKIQQDIDSLVQGAFDQPIKLTVNDVIGYMFTLHEFESDLLRGLEIERLLLRWEQNIGWNFEKLLPWFWENMSENDLRLWSENLVQTLRAFHERDSKPEHSIVGNFLEQSEIALTKVRLKHPEKLSELTNLFKQFLKGLFSWGVVDTLHRIEIDLQRNSLAFTSLVFAARQFMLITEGKYKSAIRMASIFTLFVRRLRTALLNKGLR